jgi:aminoglycoside phosphotransferase
LSRYLDQVDGALVELLDRLGAGRHDVVTLGHSGASVVRLLGAGGRPVGYLKAAPSRMRDLAEVVDAERARLDWLRARGVPVPKVVGWGREPDLTWVLTAAVRGVPMSDPWPSVERDRVVAVFGETLRALHSLEPAGCPFDFSPSARLRAARQRVGDDAALAGLASAVPDGTSVVGHGDYCLPNVLIAPGGDVHFVDVGQAGLADRHSDVADALRSIRGDLNPQFDESHAQRFLDAYGRGDIVDDWLRWFDDVDRFFRR